MAQALEYLYQIYDGFINMVFNDFALFNGVTVGWVVVSVVVFGILVNSILNIPKGAQRINVGRANSNHN